MVNNVTFCIQTLPHDNSGFSLPSPDSAVLLEVMLTSWPLTPLLRAVYTKDTIPIPAEGRSSVWA